MLLASYLNHGAPSIGAVDGDRLIDLRAGGLPATMTEFIALGEPALEAVRRLLQRSGEGIPLREVRWLPPVTPRKAVAVGLNYRDHAAEARREPPDHPVLFHRFESSWVAHREALVRPSVSAQFDYEGELVVVIGRGGRHIPPERALAHVYGYSVFNDGSVRDFQSRTSQWMMGKNFDRSGGFGPWLATADALPAGARGLRLSTRLNGRTVQDASTSQMIFDVARLISACSTPFALSPGDILITGTPAGVGLARQPPLFMQPGDVCEVEIEGIGTLVNPVAAED